jgi:hypothetical protein
MSREGEGQKIGGPERLHKKRFVPFRAKETLI